MVCETQLIITIDDFSWILNNAGGQADVILLDFQKLHKLKYVPHHRLCEKLLRENHLASLYTFSCKEDLQDLKSYKEDHVSSCNMAFPGYCSYIAICPFSHKIIHILA